MFRDDPFFSGSGMMEEFDRMDRMMSSFGMPGMMMPSIGDGRHHGHNPSSRRQQEHSMMPFGSGGGMFGNMNSMMSQMHSDPNAQFFSSSKVISYSSNGSGQPQYYEATSETTQGPHGVRQTKRSERNSETGLDRMAVGHHIYDRGHVVERIRNNRTHEREEKQDFINIDEDERDRFHDEWKSKARSNTNHRRALHNDRSSQYHREQPRAINSAEYHRHNLDRSRAEHNNRRRHYDDDRRVRINSRAEEI